MTRTLVFGDGSNWDPAAYRRRAVYRQPTLIIWAKKIGLFQLNGERLIIRFELAFVVFKECGHVPAEEKPDYC